MGGGGIVGVWWEVGVLAALRARIAWDPATATVIAGTSAGSMAGSYVALGYDLDKLIEERTADAPSAETRSFGSGDVTTMLAQELMGLYLPMTGPLEQRARRAGQLALEHGGVMDEAAYLAMMAKSVGTDAWPDADLRMTTVDCETGETHLIDRGFGMDLATAVAASCAVPTIFPPVEHEGRHYTDGPRGPFIVELAAEKDLDAVVFVGPRLVPPGFEGADEHAELDALEAKGHAYRSDHRRRPSVRDAHPTHGSIRRPRGCRGRARRRCSGRRRCPSGRRGGADLAQLLLGHHPGELRTRIHHSLPRRRRARPSRARP